MSGAYKPSYTYEATSAHMRNCSGETMQKSAPQAYAIAAAKKRKKRRILRLVCILIAFFLAALIYFQTNVTRVLISVSEATMRSSAVEAINSAVYKTLGSNPSYEDLVKIERDENGNVAALSANALKINKIARDTASISQKILQETGENGVMIPIGALTGIEALAGAGKRINIDILPVCSVVCSFSSAFESVGINQTKHSIYLNVLADISIVMASRTDHFAVQTDVLAGECVIVGKIPEMYFQTDLSGRTSGL